VAGSAAGVPSERGASGIAPAYQTEELPTVQVAFSVEARWQAPWRA
jgi:hypothetical protein